MCSHPKDPPHKGRGRLHKASSKKGEKIYIGGRGSSTFLIRLHKGANSKLMPLTKSLKAEARGDAGRNHAIVVSIGVKDGSNPSGALKGKRRRAKHLLSWSDEGVEGRLPARTKKDEIAREKTSNRGSSLRSSK